MEDTTIEIPQPSWIREPPDPDEFDDDEEPDDMMFVIRNGNLEFILHGGTVAKWDEATQTYVAGG